MTDTTEAETVEADVQDGTDTEATETVETAATDAETAETSSDETSETAAEEAPETNKSTLPDDWREQWAEGDEDLLKEIKRYTSPKSVLKALKEAKATIRSGKLKREMPDPSDEKAMAEWRKEQGIPEDPSGYKLPDTVTKRLSDDDKPILANFAEYMHQKGATNDELARASEWYISVMEDMEGQRIQADKDAKEAAEEALRKDWAHGEFKANTKLANRFLEGIPGVGADWTEARLPDGRLLGSVPEFVTWAAEMGRDHFGDSVFASSDSERQHTARKEEIEKIMNSDIKRYYKEGLDKEYGEILEREEKRRK